MSVAPGFVIINLKGSKLALGNMLPDNHFTFSVHNDDGTLATTGHNKANGEIDFQEFSLTSVGVYYYTIKEEPSQDDEWSTDPDEFAVKVTVVHDTSAPHGLRAEIEYIDGFPIFKDYHCDPEKGLIEFPCINFTKAGIYKFIIKETQPPMPGWTLDDREYEVIITITDDGEGNLIPTIQYPDGFPEFVNKYEAKSICVPLSAVKIAIGAPLRKGQFTFTVFDEEGKVVATATNDAPCEE